jgi:hypothetical protein
MAFYGIVISLEPPYTDPVSRVQSTLTLRDIDEDHLRAIRILPGGLDFAGFHMLPAGTTYTRSTSVTVPAGFVGADRVKVYDEHGSPIDPGLVTITIVPDASYNNDPFNMVRAAVTVAHPGGTATATKTFFPSAWTWSNVKQAIYDAVVSYFLAHGPLPNNRWLTQQIPGGARIRFVHDELAPGGTAIDSAFPEPGQTLTVFMQPDMTRP